MAPWRIRTAVIVAVTVTAGTVAGIIAWHRTGQTVSIERQVEWAALAVAAGMTVCLSLLFWTMSGRHELVVRLRRVAAGLETTPPAIAVAAPAAVAGTGHVDACYAAATMSRYHRDGCLLLAGKPVTPAGRETHEAAGRKPCGVCQP